jgi:hypothetical protein
LLKTDYVFSLAHSWTGFDTHNINYIKGKNKITRSGRHPKGLVLYVKNSVSNKVTEIPTEMKEVVWKGVKK